MNYKGLLLFRGGFFISDKVVYLYMTTTFTHPADSAPDTFKYSLERACRILMQGNITMQLESHTFVHAGIVYQYSLERVGYNEFELKAHKI